MTFRTDDATCGKQWPTPTIFTVGSIHQKPQQKKRQKRQNHHESFYFRVYEIIEMQKKYWHVDQILY